MAESKWLCTVCAQINAGSKTFEEKTIGPLNIPSLCPVCAIPLNFTQNAHYVTVYTSGEKALAGIDWLIREAIRSGDIRLQSKLRIRFRAAVKELSI